jgi:hypothetical protein
MRKRLALLVLLSLVVFSIPIPSYAAKKTTKKTTKTAKKTKGKAGPCVLTMSKCPVQGCGGDPKLNTAKNQTDSPSDVKNMTIARIIDLNVKSPKTWKSGSDRQPLQDLGEGGAVAVKGYLINAHASGAEACNCRLKGQANNDFHLNIITAKNEGKKKKPLMFQSLVIEMSPRSRLAGWKLPTLKVLEDQRMYVRVTGYLMYDTAHIKFQSLPRASAWEIHPIMKFEVCQATRAECDAGNNWINLEDLSN